MNGSVSLAVSISRDNLARSYTQFCFSCACVGRVQVSVAQNGDYLVFDNSHYLKAKAETVSTLRLHPRFNTSKITGRPMLHRLLRNSIVENYIKLVSNSL